jgi:hypothetical protein
MIRLLYKPLGLAVSVLGGVLAGAGAIFGLVKAVLDRSAAEGIRKLAGTWPGDGKDTAAGKGGSP